jgi:hypothetical protein
MIFKSTNYQKLVTELSNLPTMSISVREWSQQYENLKKKIQHQRINGQQPTIAEVFSIVYCLLITAHYNIRNILFIKIKNILSTLNVLESQLSTMSANPLEYEMFFLVI